MKTGITKILLAGEGGQGIQSLAKIISKLLVGAGFNVSYIPQFGPEQRGTPSVAFIQYSKDTISYPRFATADMAVILRQRAIPTVAKYLDADTQIVFDSSTINRKKITQSNANIFGLPATKIAEENFSSKVLNIIVLGALNKKFFNLGESTVWKTVEEILKKKFTSRPELKKLNSDALKFGYELTFENKIFSKPIFGTSQSLVLVKDEEKIAVIIPAHCKGCGICIYKCPVKALKFGKTLGVYGTPTPDIDIKKCIACGNCFRFCPDSAIRVSTTRK